ncbi:hypothetical protein GCM10009557_02070 [Virgisporangium ochraceum]|uniref:DUF397 domain-containing protein n=1 Tax=Virgisporangium ochraceum TaxID=65505 RepID=A0A8J3ZX79_9ACTN|nr:hypothetical protein Voc01_050570 [Virgisporangium ochraceum]
MVDETNVRQPEGWRRSSRCSDGACVEVNSSDGMVLVRSTVEPGVELRLTAEQWRSLVATVKADGFGSPVRGTDPYATTP